jgi:hypothetical protein
MWPIIQPSDAPDHRPQPRQDGRILRQLPEPQAQQPTLTIGAGHAAPLQQRVGGPGDLDSG